MGNYVANTRIKHDGEVYLPGEDVGEMEFESEDQLRQLVAANAIVTKEKWDEEHKDDVSTGNDPMGSPSNLDNIVGTALAADETGKGDSSSWNDSEEGELETVEGSIPSQEIEADDKPKTEATPGDSPADVVRKAAAPNPKQESQTEKAKGKGN